MIDTLKECFKRALQEEKGIKHKGLLFTQPNIDEAKRHLQKAQESLRFCEVYRKMEADYQKIDAPPHLKRCGLNGARFLDARSAPRSKDRGLWKHLRHKIPEEWFYALAILAKFGVESKSQRYTALFLQYVQEKEIIKYDKEFVKRITLHKEKGLESDVDEREKARYGSWIKNEEIEEKYEERTNLCKKAIEQATAIVFSLQELKIPSELLET